MMKKKTITMRWLGAVLVGVMLMSGIGLSALAQNKVRRAPADPATFEKIPANRLNAGTFTVNRATGEAVDITLQVDIWASEARWNIWSYDAAAYLYGANQGFSIPNQVVNVTEYLSPGDYSIDVWDDYGDGGISGIVKQGTTTLVQWFNDDYYSFGYFDFTVVATVPRLEITPLVLDLGQRPIDAWRKPGVFTLTNTGTGSVTVNASELDAPAFFALNNPTLPITLEEGESVEVGVYTPGDATPGLLTGSYVAQWGASRAVSVADFAADAYIPIQGNVWENPFIYANVNAPYGSGINSALGLNNVYELPDALPADGRNFVYKFVIPNDRLFFLDPLTTANAKWALYADGFEGVGGPDVDNSLVHGTGVIAGYPLFAGTYYLVFSTTGVDFNVYFDVSVAMPVPDAATYIAPSDGAINITNGMDLEWAFGDNTFEYQLILGTTYPPTTIVVDWTSNLATSYTLTNTQPNLQYFWKVNTRNTSGTTINPEVWGFTTTITPPANLDGNAEVYMGQNVVLTWDSPLDRALLGYNVYRDGIKINNAILTAATFTDVAPAYNMLGYDYNVTSVFDEGESAYSNTFTAQVTGKGTVSGNVKDALTSANLSGATVALVGEDEFGVDQTMTLTTDANGNYTGMVWAGVYDIRVSFDGYITQDLLDVNVPYNTTVTNNFLLLEVPYPVDFVIASELNDNSVMLEWGFDLESFVPQHYPFDTKGMSASQIERAWKDFLGTNGYNASGNGTSNRALVEFQVWREKVYLPGAFEQIGTTSQTQFVDFDWGIQDWGVYKWYIVAVYTASQSAPVGSNSLDKDMNTMVDVTVALNSGDSPAGTLVEFTNVSEPELALGYSTLLGSSGTYQWSMFRRGTYDIMVSLPGYGTITETNVDIFDESSFEWLMDEILAKPTNLYVTPTGLATWEGGSVAPFAPVLESFDEGIPADWTQVTYSGNGFWEFCDNCGAGYEPINTDGKFAIANSDGNSSLVFDVGLFTAPYDLTGETAIYLDYDRNFQDYAGDGEISVKVYSGGTGAGNFEEQLDWATTDDPGAGIHKTYMIDPSGYADPSNVYFEFWYSTNGNTWAWLFAIDNVLVTNVAPAVRSFQAYKVFHDGVLVAEVTQPMYQYGTNGEALVDGETYLAEVAAVFSTGQSDRASYTWTYIACDNYPTPGSFAAVQLEGTIDVSLTWTTPTIPPADDQIAFARIYRDGEVLAEVTDGSYLDESLDFGTYTYCITFVYESGAETCPATICQTVEVTGAGTVNGNVKAAAYLGGANIEGAEVKLTNTDDNSLVFTFTTNAAGNYSGEVLAGTYDYLVSASGYTSATLSDVFVAETATVTNNFVLMEYPFPVSNVVAVDQQTSALIYWNSPGATSGGSNTVYEEFDNGMPSMLVTDTPAASWTVANDLLNLNTTGAGVWRSAYYNSEFTDFVYEVEMQRTVGSTTGSMGIYVRGNGLMNPIAGNGGYANVFTITQGGSYWYATMLNGDLMGDWTGWLTSSAINTSGPNVISAVASGTTIQFMVNGILVHTVTNTTLTGGYCGVFAHEGTAAATTVWDYMMIEPGAVVRNYATNNVSHETKGNLQEVFLTYENNVEPKGLEVHTPKTGSSRELTGYNVWRTSCDGSAGLTFLGYTLDTTFVDNQFGNLDAGVYKWAVEAVYTNNTAEPQFSNCLDKDMVTTVSVSVITNSLDSPEETDVMFTNTSEPDLELVYETTLDASGVYTWDEFRKGTYDIYVEKNGFAPISITGYVIDGPEVFEWVLEELLLPVADLYVTPTGYATWRNGGIIPFEPFMEDFNNGLPESWTIVDGGSNSFTWGLTTSYNGNSIDGTPFMFANSDAAGSGSTMDEQLISPVINAENADELYLMFDYVYQYIGNEHFSVDVYDGADWVEVFYTAADSGPFPWGPTVSESIDVTEYANPMFQVRFNYVSNGWNWYVAVDNVVVTDNMDRYANRELQYYKVWLDGVFATDTENTFYQYDTQNLIPGQEYLAEVAAMYTTGMSAKMQYVWTYLPCDSFPGPVVFNGEVIDETDVLLTWSDVVPLELIQITQNPGAPANGYYQNYGYGYGVAYDLSAYPDALVNSLDFHHASWGVTGTWNYKIHIYNWDTKTLIGTYGPFQTTGNDIWEMGVELGDISTGGASTVALLMEPLSNSATDAYPDLSSDNEANPQGSIYGPLSDVNAIGSSTIGNFLMNMYIYTAYGAVQATPVNFDLVKAPAAQSRLANASNVEIPVIHQSVNKTSRIDDPFMGANIYRDGMMIAEMVADTFYLDMDVDPGTYNYCITYVYESGAESCADANCIEVSLTEDCVAPVNLVAELVDGTNEVSLMWNQPQIQEFRYDDGVATGQLGFTGGTISSVLGSKHNTSAELTEMSWYLTSEGGPHTTVQIYVFGLTGAGLPDGNNVLYTASVSNTDETWNTYTFPAAVMAEGGFFLGIGANGFVGLGTDDGVGAPYVFQNNTHYFADDYTAGGWATWESVGFAVNGLIRAIGVPGAVASYAVNTNTTTVSNSDFVYTASSQPVITGEPKWETSAQSADREFVGYNIYREGALLEELWPETTYTYVEVTPGNTCYTVTAVYSLCGESEPSNEACVDVPVGIDNPDMNSVMVYPNPSNSIVNLKLTQNISQVVVYNYVGQVVFEQNITKAQIIGLNVSQYESGAYLVKFVTRSGESFVKKVVVTK